MQICFFLLLFFLRYFSNRRSIVQYSIESAYKSQPNIKQIIIMNANQNKHQFLIYLDCINLHANSWTLNKVLFPWLIKWKRFKFLTLCNNIRLQLLFINYTIVYTCIQVSLSLHSLFLVRNEEEKKTIWEMDGMRISMNSLCTTFFFLMQTCEWNWLGDCRNKNTHTHKHNHLLWHSIIYNKTGKIQNNTIDERVISMCNNLFHVNY